MDVIYGDGTVSLLPKVEEGSFYQHGDTVLQYRMCQDMGSRVSAGGNVDLLAMNSINGTAANISA